MSGLIGMLQEDVSTSLKTEALKRLHETIDSCWMEIDDITLIEKLYEDDEFPLRDMAAAVASKFYFHLEQFEDAVEFALFSGRYFSTDSKSEYVDTIVSKCIDSYIEKQQKDYATSFSSKEDQKDEEDEDEDPEISEKMTSVVERMFERCYADGQHMQALGIALESRRLDHIERSIIESDDVSTHLDFCFNFCRLHVSHRGFRQVVLKILAKLYRTHCDTPDYINVCQCLQFLGDAEGVAEVLLRLLKRSDEDSLVSYQVAFRIYENENQQFMRDIIRALPDLKKDDEADKKKEEEEKEEDKEEPKEEPKEEEELPKEIQERLERLVKILDGRTTMELHLAFLCANNKTDLLILKKMKDSFQRNSVLHNAVVVAHAYMNSGTTQHTFLRNNEQWLTKATNWARFSAIGGIGVVHKGHINNPMQLLKPYLPATDADKNKKPYCEGGAYFALGLIHANRGWTDGGKMVEFLLNKVRGTRNNTVLHGACLGLSTAAMATGGEAIQKALTNTLLQTDDAVAGEAAAYGLGLVNVGRGTAASAQIEEMLSYAHSTKHEKIIRGLSLGVALIMYGQEEVADALIEQMLRDKDHIIRYGGCFAVAMAYCGSSNNEAIGRLLHVAVSDVNPNVRRAAVMCLGFVMIREPEKMPQVVSLLSISYCPHVRYGACLAVGVACAGSAHSDAIDMLKPMMSDKIDFVRQGAFISMAMVLMQESKAKCDALDPFVKKLFSVVEDKHQPTMAKMGAMLGLGILNAGGRNVTIGLTSNAGFRKMASIVGVMLSLQYWYWYPLMHFMSLSFTPTSMIGLDGEMRMPVDFSATCHKKASMFAYLKPLEEKKDKEKKRIKTVELSTSAKARARRKKLDRQKSGGSESMDVVEEKKETEEQEQEEEEKKEEEEETKKEEPKTFVVSNPSRVTRAQRCFVTFNSSENRYEPVVSDAQKAMGIVILRDKKPSEPGKFVEVDLTPLGDEQKEPEPPGDFVWTPPKKD